MVNKLDQLLQFHSQALNLRAHRQQILASNIANADTPNFKARDIDFQQALRNALTDSHALSGSKSSAGSKAPADSKATSTSQSATPELLYRTVFQPSADGNTVDMDVERAHFAENAARYEASLTFLNGQIKGLLAAIQG